MTAEHREKLWNNCMDIVVGVGHVIGILTFVGLGTATFVTEYSILQKEPITQSWQRVVNGVTGHHGIFSNRPLPLENHARHEPCP